MYRILLVLTFISLPLSAVNILNYEIKKNNMQDIEILLLLDEDWNGSVEQESSDEEIVFIFKNLKTKLSLQNSTTVEYANLKQSNKNETRLTLKSDQSLDATILKGTKNIRINLTQKPTPLTMESIANSAHSGNLRYILDILFYIVIFLALVCVVFFVFIKAKLFTHMHTKTDKIENSNPNIEPLDEKQHEVKETVSIKDETEDIKKTQKSKKTKTSSQKKSSQTKSLFDL
ncbi:MAG: hypothetical protein LBG21_02230 [Campylobacteraceae bacterium]|jgi:hypothetical protein|nr:hypothetical protein [Campylobacteraceae bacterium]